MKKLSAALCAAASAFAISAAQAGVIDGRVTDGTGTVGLEGATIVILETGQVATADRDGGFRFANVPAGDYTLETSYIGADPLRSSVTLETDSVTARPEIAIGDDVAVRDNVLVVGQRGALNSAISRQRASDRIITVLSSDAIGQLPDENVAEAARRAPGVNIQNDQGEGRFVSIRGANPNFVTTTLNGIRLTSPEADARQVPLDVIDSDILASVVITKSLTPDVDGDSIGGNIDIQTLSGLDQDDMLVKLKAAGIYTDQVEEFGQRYSGVFANKFLGGQLGVAGSVAWQRREFGSENIEVDDSEWTLDESVPYPDELEFRDYQITRERLSASLNLDYQHSDSTLFYVHGLYSDFSDQEYRSRVENKFGDPDFDAVNSGGTVAVLDGAADDPMEIDRDIKDRLETQKIYSIAGGMEVAKGPIEFDAVVAYTYAEEAEPDRLDTAFRSDEDLDAGFTGLFGIDVADTILPSLSFPDPAAEAAYFNADGFGFDGLELTNGLSQDEETTIAANLKYDIADFFGGPGFVKSGFKIRSRNKRFNLDLQVFDGFSPRDLVLSEFVAPVDFALETINPVPSAGLVRDFFFANQSDFELNAVDTALESASANYTANEDVFAAYIMGQRRFGDVSVIAGVRVEHTEYEASGFNVLEQEFEDDFAGDLTANPEAVVPAPAVAGTLLAEDIDADFDAVANETTVEAARIYSQGVNTTNSYTDYLPSVNVRYDATDELVLRFGYYMTIVRPNLEDAAPRAAVAQDEDNEVEGELGNPNLSPQKAQNFDASIEFYPGNSSVISLGVFYKDIDDFIATSDISGLTVNGIAFDDGTLPINLTSAELYGAEFNFQMPLDMLPSPFDGLIVGANYTYVDSEASLESGRQIGIPGQSQHVATGILGYDKGPFDIRVAATYRDEYLDEIGSDADIDRYVDDHLQIDVSAKYKITDQWKVFTEFKNINDEAFVATIRPAGFSRLNSQYETYGWSAKFGIQFTY